MSDTPNKIEAVSIDLSALPVASADGKLPKAPRIPYAAYKFRIQDEPEFQKSKKADEPMLVFPCELVEPENAFVDGAEGRVAGAEFSLYAMLVRGKTDNLRNIHKQNGLPESLTFNPETGLPVGITYKGLEFYATASSETTEQQTETATGMVTLTNPLTGKPLTTERKNINRVLSPDA